MAEEGSTNNEIQELKAYMTSQARFTRMLVVVCTLAIFAGMFYTMTLSVQAIPQLVYATFSEKLEAINMQWRQIDHRLNASAPAPKVEATPAAKAE